MKSLRDYMNLLEANYINLGDPDYQGSAFDQAKNIPEDNSEEVIKNLKLALSKNGFSDPLVYGTQSQSVYGLTKVMIGASTDMQVDGRKVPVYVSTENNGTVFIRLSVKATRESESPMSAKVKSLTGYSHASVAVRSDSFDIFLRRVSDYAKDGLAVDEFTKIFNWVKGFKLTK